MSGWEYEVWKVLKNMGFKQGEEGRRTAASSTPPFNASGASGTKLYL